MCNNDSEYWFKSKGTLVYDPHGRVAKAVDKVSEPWWLLLFCDQDIVNYANYWLKKKGIYLFKHSIYGSHVSIVKGEEPPKKEFWKKYHKSIINFKYSKNIYNNGNYWWLFARCLLFEKIRLELGLPENPPYFKFHLTVGRKNQ